MTHPNARSTDADFIGLVTKVGPTKAAKILGISPRNAKARRRSLENKYKKKIEVPAYNNSSPPQYVEHPHEVNLTVKDGTVIVGSDGHYWPGKASTAHRAFVKLIKDLSPKAVFMNGDAFDGARISRHPSIMWENKPEVIQELEAVQERMHEIELAAPRSTALVWPLGNHDARFETRLATMVPEYARINGFHLKDHFSNRWQPCWLAWINRSVVIKHRYKGGIHATHNATMWAGTTTITGHLHSLKVTPFTDYNGTRYGIDTGTLADPNGKQFLDYSEGNPKNHRSGFIVLTFRGGRLMWPEVVSVVDENHVEFRGEIIRA